METWRRARAAGVALPPSSSPNYQSFEHLLLHVVRVPGMNMLWLCEKLGLPQPSVPEPPAVEGIAAHIDDYLPELFVALGLPLVDVAEERFYDPAWETRWKRIYCAEAMLEHLVTHPQRHALQLQELMERSHGGF